jgi:filamentous hemagglutinin family protein
MISFLESLTLTKNYTILKQIILLVVVCVTFLPQRGFANQNIVPDNSINPGEQSVVVDGQIINGNNASLIQGGALRGSSLFHSFSQLNVETGESAYFQSNPNINIIFARVTGSSSFINGILGVFGGTSDLFLINPRGIIFGKNAQLDLNGSFTATTADRIVFENYEFDARDPNSIPILTIEKPIGMFFSESSGDITIRNDGVQIFQPILNQLPPAIFQNNTSNLSVIPGQSLSFFGRNVIFDGGVINLNSGNLNIGAVKSGFIEFNKITGNSNVFFPENTISYGDIFFLNNSFILNTNLFGGSINLFGKNVNLLNNSTVAFIDIGSQNNGEINIVATNDINISGEPNQDIPQGFKRPVFGILSINFGTEAGSDIDLDAANINVLNNGVVFSIAYNNGTGGNLSLNASNSITIDSNVSFSIDENGSTIGSGAFGTGNSGSINIISPLVSIKNGSIIGTNTQGVGNAGDITVNANQIIVDGFNPLNFIPSTLSSSTVGEGDSGTLRIQSKDLFITNGANIGVATFSSGDAKSVFIDADNILISGSSPDSINSNSFIFASANRISNISAFPVFNGANLDLTGNSGDIFIQTQALTITDGGQIIARNNGSGDAGSINITANQLALNDSLISSSANGGNGGNINLNTESLVMQSGLINSATTGNGNGGNTTVTTQAIAGDYNSFISANADQGTGGDILINTDTLIFPLQNITSSSNRGIDFSGTVEINAANFGPQQRKEIQPERFTEPTTTTCNPSSDKVSFVITGDDIPSRIDDLAETDSPIKKAPFFIDNSTGKKIPLIEMQGWVDKGNGMATPIAYNEGAFGGSYRSQACKNLAKSANESR